jgi:predicted P-loop ATPase
MISWENAEWVTKLDRHYKTGNLLKTFRNFELILENDPNLKGAFAYESQRRNIIVLRPLPWKVKSGLFDNHDYAALRGYIEKTYGLWDKSRLDDALIVVAGRDTHD